MSAILAGTTTATTLVGDIFTMITGNPLLCVFVCIGLLCSAVGVFRALKRAAR